MLRAADVSFAYDARQPVLTGVSLDVRPGALLGILGPNGSGKTTLLRLLGGMRTPTAGRVTLDDRPLHDYSRRQLARRIAVVPQETHLAFDYSVMEMVLMGRHPHLGVLEVEGPADFAVGRDALVATGAAHLESRDFATLSGGEKQRVVIAAALAQAAGILLLDEPTSSLDIGAQLEIAEVLDDLHRTRGVTIVASTHDLAWASRVCRHLVLLRAGRVVAEGPSVEVLTPEHVRAVYDVEADVLQNPGNDGLTVVPRRRAR